MSASHALSEIEGVLIERARGTGRIAAADAFARTGLPHRRVEAFKWSDIRAAWSDAAPAALADAKARFSLDDLHTIDLRDGVLLGGDASVEDNDGAVSTSVGAHPMALLAVALAPQIVSYRRSGLAREAVHIRRRGGHGASASRVKINVPAGGEAIVVESFDNSASSRASDLTEITLGDGARLKRFVIQSADDGAVLSACAHIDIGAGAVLEQTTLAFGARLARLETNIFLAGDNARADLASACLLSEARHADLTSRVDHRARGCATRQAHRLVAADRAHGVFQGKFFVGREGQKTDARMESKALLLSDGAAASQKPELEIYADDVECAHGATVGAIDADAYFYLRQRGLDAHAARALLIEAFIGEAIEARASGPAEPLFRSAIFEWLRAQ